ncbi:MAG: MCE family protein [Actinomycetota bacterium]|nr:MCE family protein [Actinomycetota bacterium]
MNRYIKPLAYAAVLIVLVGGGLLAYGARSKDDTYRVTAYFEKAIGLFPNSDVDILGVPVGTIVSVEPDGDRVEVVMEIQDGYKVPADAFAQIVPISVIADRYIQLAPVYERGPALEDGAVIDVDRTQIPAELDDVFRQLKKLLDAIKPGKSGGPGPLGDLIVQLDRTLSDREEDLQGTLINTAELTDTLAGAQEDISGLLINLDDLFGTLATRADSFGELNRNFAVVMETLAASRQDLEGTLTNLAGLTNEVGDLVRDHRVTLGRDLGLASNVISTILDNRASFEEALRWLPVVAQGITQAYHPPPFDDIDVRDNAQAHLCEDLRDLPNGLPDPVKELLQDLVTSLCPGGGTVPAVGRKGADANGEGLQKARLLLDCDEGIRRVKRQIRRLSSVDSLPQEAIDEVIRPLRKQLRELRKECKELGDAIDDSGAIDDLLDGLLDAGGVGEEPEIDPVPDVTGLTGNAAGPAVVPTDTTGPTRRLGSWVDGFFGFLGWSS